MRSAVLVIVASLVFASGAVMNAYAQDRLDVSLQNSAAHSSSIEIRITNYNGNLQRTFSYELQPQERRKESVEVPTLGHLSVYIKATLNQNTGKSPVGTIARLEQTLVNGNLSIQLDNEGMLLIFKDIFRAETRITSPWHFF